MKNLMMLLKQKPDDIKYQSTFENCYGERWVLVSDEKDEIFFTGDDIDYKVYQIKNWTIPWELVLQDEERLWIQSCLKALKIRFDALKGKG